MKNNLKTYVYLITSELRRGPEKDPRLIHLALGSLHRKFGPKVYSKLVHRLRLHQYSWFQFVITGYKGRGYGDLSKLP